MCSSAMGVYFLALFASLAALILLAGAVLGEIAASNSHYGPVTPRRVRAPGLHTLQNRPLVGRVPQRVRFRPTPAFFVTSVKVPSPLLWYSTFSPQYVMN